MGLIDPLLCDDIDILASELLKQEDPDPQDLMVAMLMGNVPSQSDPQLIVDGIPYG